MDSSSSSTVYAPSNWDYFNIFLLRPILAILFVLSFLLLGWFLAWKLVLVHVPLIQEIFGLRKKPLRPKPPTRRRLTKFYNSLNAKDWHSQREIIVCTAFYGWSAIRGKTCEKNL